MSTTTKGAVVCGEYSAEPSHDVRSLCAVAYATLPAHADVPARSTNTWVLCLYPYLFELCRLSRRALKREVNILRMQARKLHRCQSFIPLRLHLASWPCRALKREVEILERRLMAARGSSALGGPGAAAEGGETALGVAAAARGRSSGAWGPEC